MHEVNNIAILSQEHKKKDDLVFKFFKEAIDDIGSVFVINKKKRSYTSERVQLICVFTFIDVVASYWYEYLGKSGTQKERFTAWILSYCFTEKNELYKEINFENLTEENLYAFRNSLVHFFGIAGLKSNYKISIATNSISDDIIKKIKEGFQKQGHSVIIIKPKKFYNFVLEGAILMLDEWRKIINESQNNENKKWQHIFGIDRIYKKIQSEGAAKVMISQNE